MLIRLAWPFVSMDTRSITFVCSLGKSSCAGKTAAVAAERCQQQQRQQLQQQRRRNSNNGNNTRTQHCNQQTVAASLATTQNDRYGKQEPANPQPLYDCNTVCSQYVGRSTLEIYILHVLRFSFMFWCLAGATYTRGNGDPPKHMQEVWFIPGGLLLACALVPLAEQRRREQAMPTRRQGEHPPPSEERLCGSWRRQNPALCARFSRRAARKGGLGFTPCRARPSDSDSFTKIEVGTRQICRAWA